MASLISTTTSLSCASANTIHKLSDVKSLSNRRCSNLIGPFMVLDAESASLAKLLRKLKPYGHSTVHLFQHRKPWVVCLSHVVTRLSIPKFRAYFGGGSEDALDVDDDNGVEHTKDDTDDLLPDSESQDDNFEIEIEKTGNNSRKIRSKVAVQAGLQTIWDILTDYERLADYIPGLAVSQLLEKRDNFARLYQIGEKNLAFGLKFKAKGTIDCFEKDLQILPFGQKRDIEFKMVEGDFKFFEGKWSIEQVVKANDGDLERDYVVGQEFQTTLVYIVHVKPKVWLPVRLIESRLCKEIQTNLTCLREVAEKAFQISNSAFVED